MQNLHFIPGYAEVYSGCMRSGKGLTIMHRIDKLSLVPEIKVKAFKPDKDYRNGPFIYSRLIDKKYPCTFLDSDNPEQIFNYINNEKVIILDEAQFFGGNIVPVINKLKDAGIHLVIAGLDQDYQRQPFGSMPQILAVADYSEKLTAICEEPGCGKIAQYTRRNIFFNDVVMIEAKPEHYSATCLGHHFVITSLEDQLEKSKKFLVPKPDVKD